MNLQRRNVLKGGAALAAAPLFSSVTASNLLGAELNTANVRNGEVLTAAHWGMLKVSVKDGKIRAVSKNERSV